VQTCTPLPEQRVVVGVHAVPASEPASWAASSPEVASTVTLVVASGALPPFASWSPPASVPPLPELPLHAATTTPQKIETESSRMARPFIMIAFPQDARCLRRLVRTRTPLNQ
jgi:hypothetical protein